MFLVGFTLPVLTAIAVAVWLQQKRLDVFESRLHHRFDEINARRMRPCDDGGARRAVPSPHEINHRLDEMTLVLRDIQATLKEMGRRLTVQEERGSPIIRQ